ncbi:MAG: biotin--[acetyl-CoA-carboxylase] ligase [Lachnospiraceae bacterium]|nr:biotin--[acetyl-CoA-carboxylase] ligase [Lachnospiraceae bacterium]
MKSKILALLRESEGYLSGQDLCERFGVTRAAIWKAIRQLQKEGYEIEAVRNRGYRLVVLPDVLNRDELESRLRTDWAGKNIEYHASLGSTNVRAKAMAEEGAPEGTLVVADEQTAGRGRRGRSWSSPAGKNLYFSLLLRPDFAPDKAPMLTLVMALAVHRAIEEVGGCRPDIKWPNDIVLNGKKVTGILTEMSLQSDYIDNVVIGVGVNVKAQEFSPEIADKAVSLETELKKSISRALLLEKIMEYFEKDYALFLERMDLSLLMEHYNACLVNRNREVEVLEPAGAYKGIAEGINPKGELMVRLPDGEVKEIYAGEVSVRGVFGYV